MQLINNANPANAPSTMTTHYGTTQFGGLSSANGARRTGGARNDGDSSIQRQSVSSAAAASRYNGG